MNQCVRQPMTVECFAARASIREFGIWDGIRSSRSHMAYFRVVPSRASRHNVKKAANRGQSYFPFQSRAKILGLARFLIGREPLGAGVSFRTIHRCVLSHLGQCKVCTSNPG
jgi:hypothetical protein